MKKNLLALGIILMAALTFTACSDDNDFDDGRQQPEVANPTTYVACAGNFKANDGTVGILFYNATAPRHHPSVITMLILHRTEKRWAMPRT